MKSYVDNRMWKILIIIVCVIVVGALAYSSYLKEKNSCMGIQILSAKDAEKYMEYTYQDFSKLLRHKDELVSVDVEDSTIYISQNIDSETAYYDLQGVITIDDPNYYLYFEEDEALTDLDKAVKEGYAFSLLITDGSHKYMQYDVIFTTLPLIRLEGEITHKDDEGRDVLTGNVCIWTPVDPECEEYTVKSSDLEWHHRGGTTANLKKKSWKMSLKKENGENGNLSICGLGSDDDWVLNAMALDDSKMREHLFMDLWNEVVNENAYSYKMSSGEYVEVVVNGKYVGLYMIQRRIDSKYLELDDDTALIRGKRLLTAPTSVYDGYEIRESNLPEDEVYEVMHYAVYSGQWTYLIDLNNFVDTNLFIGMAVASDNSGYNNMYWIIEKTGNEELPYRVSMVPWDTDMSFGIVAFNKFSFDYDTAIYCDVSRSETVHMMKRPEYVDKMFTRWEELRNTTLETEHVLAYLEEYKDVLESSGAFERDKMCNGKMVEGEDTYENLRRFIVDRLEWMDTIYMN